MSVPFRDLSSIDATVRVAVENRVLPLPIRRQLCVGLDDLGWHGFETAEQVQRQ